MKILLVWFWLRPPDPSCSKCAITFYRFVFLKLTQNTHIHTWQHACTHKHRLCLPWIMLWVTWISLASVKAALRAHASEENAAGMHDSVCTQKAAMYLGTHIRSEMQKWLSRFDSAQTKTMPPFFHWGFCAHSVVINSTLSKLHAKIHKHMSTF